MNPYYFVKQIPSDKSILSLCCGIGFELSGLPNEGITAVDIAQQYLDQVHDRCPQAKLICSDTLEFLKLQKDNSYDYVSMLDGLEHMDKSVGKQVLKHIKRVAKDGVLLFIPQGLADDGYLKNEPHNAWGIEGADDYQLHKSGWTKDEIVKSGFTLVHSSDDVSQHGEQYTALMFKYEK